MFELNQVVRGKSAGVFVVVGKGIIFGQIHYSVKEVNPTNLSDVARGESLYTEDMLRPY